jgi:hypothetical protein
MINLANYKNLSVKACLHYNICFLKQKANAYWISFKTKMEYLHSYLQKIKEIKEKVQQRNYKQNENENKIKCKNVQTLNSSLCQF